MTARYDGATLSVGRGRKSEEPSVKRLVLPSSVFSLLACLPLQRRGHEWFIPQEGAHPPGGLLGRKHHYLGLNPDSKQLSQPRLLLATNGVSDKDTEGLGSSSFLEKSLQRGREAGVTSASFEKNGPPFSPHPTWRYTEQ